MRIHTIQKLINLITEEKTGNALVISEKLEISERMVYKYLQIIKQDFNAPVVYCRKKKSYVYAEKGQLNLYWQKK
jgi:hypothetical protein